MSPEDRGRIEELTRGQRTNSNWFLYRRGRITASNFGAVLAAEKRGSYPDSLHKTLVGSYCLEGVKAIQWGIDNENEAVTAYQQISPLEKIAECGFYINESGMLGASPDRLCGENGILEVKCPFKHRNNTIVEAIACDKKFYLYMSHSDQSILLKTDHTYYDQIQGQLYVTGRAFCMFVVYTIKECVAVKIDKDINWASNIQRLETFYKEKYLPKLLEEMGY